MKIAAVEVGKISIPLKKTFKTALRQVDSAEDIIVKVIADSGVTGYGNAPPTAVITGDTQKSVTAAIYDSIAPAIVGRDIADIEGTMAVIDVSLHNNSSAKAAVDIAVYDLYGKCYGLPVYKLLGGYRHSITTDITISLNSPAEMVQDACAAVAAGYRELKLKVGSDKALDIRRVRDIRAAVGPLVKIRLDANQSWQPKEAVRIIRQFEAAGLDIELVEQPVAAADFDGLKYVTDNVLTDIMADESAFGPKEVFKLLAMRACDLINIKLMKAGGIHNALKIAALAETAGVPCMMGCMLESKVGIAAAASVACAKRIITKADLDAALLLADDPVAGGVSFAGNVVQMSEEPGFGIAGIEGWQPI